MSSEKAENASCDGRGRHTVQLDPEAKGLLDRLKEETKANHNKIVDAALQAFAAEPLPWRQWVLGKITRAQYRILVAKETAGKAEMTARLKQLEGIGRRIARKREQRDAQA